MSNKETIEEAAEIYSQGWGEDNDFKAFIAGAQWQAERMYSEEEVEQMLFDLGDVLYNNCQNGIKEGEPKEYIDLIINQFKKK